MVLVRQCDGCKTKGEDVAEYGFDSLDYCTPCRMKASIVEYKEEYKHARKHIHDVHIVKLRRMRSNIKDLELKLKEVKS